MATVSPDAQLGTFLARYAKAIERRTLSALKRELGRSELKRERKEAVASELQALAATLVERGGLEAPRLWAEHVRPRGAEYLEGRREAGDLIRELYALQRSILEEWESRIGQLSPEVAALIGECIGEGAAAAVTDYSRRQRNERTQFREEALLQTLLTHLDEGLLLIESDGTLSYATEPIFGIFGEELRAMLGEQIDGAHMAELLERHRFRTLEGEAIGVDDLSAVGVIRHGLPPHRIVARIREGTASKAVELNTIVIWHDDASDLLRGVITTARDLSNDVRRAQDLRRANEELARLQGAQLARSRATAIGELANGAAHALNNLLNPMRLRTLRLREACTASPGSIPSTLDELERGLGELAALAQGLQELARPESGGAAERVELNQLLRSTLALVRPEAEGARVSSLSLQLDLAGRPVVRANRAELRELLISALLRARERLRAGGTLRIASRGEVHDGYVRCTLASLPVQAPEGEQQHALSLQTHIERLRSWGGELVIERLAEGGEQLSLKLGVAPREEESASAEVAHTDWSPGVKKILVVDDDADNAEVLAAALASEGHQVATALSGAEGLECWNRESFDVGLIDLMMPDIKGGELVRRFSLIRPLARLAIITGWEAKEAERAAPGARAVFRKPVELEDLLRFVAGQ